MVTLWWNINTDNELVYIIFNLLYYLFLDLKKSVELQSAIHFVGSEEKLTLQIGNIFLQTLEYLPRARNFEPKFEFQTSLGAKFSRWNLGIILLLAPTWILLGFGDSRRL